MLPPRVVGKRWLLFPLCILAVSACQSPCPKKSPPRPLPGQAAQHLRPGKSIVCFVYAQLPCNDTLLDVARGERYRFVVNSEQTWCDACHQTTPDGYPSTPYLKLWESGKRLPKKDWFVLCGGVNHNEDRFRIGAGISDHTCTASGHLCLFANDHPLFYWNNSGVIKVLIQRKK